MPTTGVKLDSSVDVLKGNLHLFVGDLPVAFETSSTLNLSTEEIDVSNKMMGDWSGSLAGKKSFTISCESLVTRKEGALSYDTLLEKQIAGNPLDFFFGDATAADKDNFGGTFTKDTSKKNYTGKAIITSLEIKSDNGAIVSCSASFKGVGALSPVEAVVPGA